MEIVKIIIKILMLIYASFIIFCLGLATWINIFRKEKKKNENIINRSTEI